MKDDLFFLKRTKELGIKECIKKVSVRNIKSIDGMLIRYLLI